jgi:hypothetical protein
LSNDLGRPAWSIGSGSSGWQYGYLSGALSSAEKLEMQTDGFTLTVVMRVLPGVAPAYSAGLPVTIAGANVDTGSVRWEIGVGLDAAGDAVVVLPNTLDNAGPGYSIREFGASYVLPGSGNQLRVAPGEAAASLWVNGNDVLNGYTGNTSFVGDRGLVFGAFSGGQGNFNQVGLSVPTGVPEPSTWAMALAGFVSLAFVGYRQKQKGASLSIS